MEALGNNFLLHSGEIQWARSGKETFGRNLKNEKMFDWEKSRG